MQRQSVEKYSNDGFSIEPFVCLGFAGLKQFIGKGVKLKIKQLVNDIIWLARVF